jgi:hypothetical protein
MSNCSGLDNNFDCPSTLMLLLEVTLIALSSYDMVVVMVRVGQAIKAQQGWQQHKREDRIN